MATDELSGKPDEMLEGNLVVNLHPGRSSDTPRRISSCWISDWFTAEFSLAQSQSNELRNHTLLEFEFNVVLRLFPSPTRSLNVYLLKKHFLQTRTYYVKNLSIYGIFFQCFPKFLMDISNVLDNSKPARTLLAALSVSLLAGTELIDMVSVPQFRTQV